MLGAIVGAFAAFSTIGFLLLLITLGAIFIMRIRSLFAKLFLVFVLCLGAYPVALYAPYIGLEAKQDTHGASVTDRTLAMSNVWSVLGQHPFGSGLFSGREANTGINLVAATGQIGIVGFFLQFFMLSGWRQQRGRMGRLKLLICAPLLITALISQPIAGSPMMYILPMFFLVLTPGKSLKGDQSKLARGLPSNPGM